MKNAVDYYYFPNSHWSRVISMMLHNKGLSPRKHFVDIRENKTFEPDYLRLNPKGVVPTLVDDGRIICNSPVIAAHLDQHYPTPLMFQRHPDAGRIQRWAKELEEFPLMLFSYSVWVLGQRGERSKDILNDKVERARRYAQKHLELSALYTRKADFFAAFRAQVYDADYVAEQTQRWQGSLDRLAVEVETNDFIGGSELSFADCIATSILYRLVDLERLHRWHSDAAHPLSRYFKRLKATPSFRYVYQQDELIP